MVKHANPLSWSFHLRSQAEKSVLAVMVTDKTISSFVPLRLAGFKCFSGLTRLSFRRSSDKSDSRTSPSKLEGGVGCDAAATAAFPSVLEVVMDDIDGMRPRAGSYVRSSENYTHIGTLPRMFRKRKDKNSKGDISRLFTQINN